jgi:hypothetical protein
MLTACPTLWGLMLPRGADRGTPGLACCMHPPGSCWPASLVRMQMMRAARSLPQTTGEMKARAYHSQRTSRALCLAAGVHHVQGVVTKCCKCDLVQLQ